MYTSVLPLDVTPCNSTTRFLRNWNTMLLYASCCAALSGLGFSEGSVSPVFSRPTSLLYIRSRPRSTKALMVALLAPLSFISSTRVISATGCCVRLFSKVSQWLRCRKQVNALSCWRALCSMSRAMFSVLSVWKLSANAT